jgi:selenocysteine lyase/cysteine desulfurase
LSHDLSAGIVCFEVAGMSPDQVVTELRRKRIVASVTPYATQYARVAPGLLNSEAEIEMVLKEVRALAGGPS